MGPKAGQAVVEGSHAGRAGVKEGKYRDAAQSVAFYGAKRHVPRFHHGLKIPTPPAGGVQAVAPLQGAHFCLARCAINKCKSPKRGVAASYEGMSKLNTSFCIDSLCALRRRA